MPSEDHALREAAKFGHHPDPATDFCLEVEELVGMAYNRRVRFDPEPALDARVNAAMRFRVGGDPIAVRAKQELRHIEAALSATPTQADADDHLRFIRAARDFYDAGSEKFRPGYEQYGDLLTVAEAVATPTPAPIDNEALDQPTTVAFIREWMLSGDYPVSQWERDFAKAIDARSTPDPLTDEALVEEVAQWLHDETGDPESYPHRTWPEHPNDTGQREGGWVKIVPSDVQAHFRERARRLVPWFTRAVLALPSIATCKPSLQVEPSFQSRVQPWLLECFGEQIAGGREERNHRFLEEALELVQACGCTASEAHQLVDYTFGRPIGEPAQEVGGVMVTLAALCLANGLDMDAAAETELARIWMKVEKIRAKQAAKPKHSPLPESTALNASKSGPDEAKQAPQVATPSALVEEAIGALEPFAKLGRMLDGPFAPALFRDDQPVGIGGAWSENDEPRTITYGDLRHAAATLAKLKEGRA